MTEQRQALEATAQAMVSEGKGILAADESNPLAAAHLNAMNAIGNAPWELSFSDGRALQAAPLKQWAGQDANEEAAQAAFAHRARCNSEARRARYSDELEHALTVA